MAISFTKKNRGSDRIMSDEDAQAIIDKADNNWAIEFRAINPKMKNTATWLRWNNYCAAKTVAEYLKLNPSKEQEGDLLFAIARGHIKLSPPAK